MRKWIFSLRIPGFIVFKPSSEQMDQLASSIKVNLLQLEETFRSVTGCEAITGSLIWKYQSQMTNINMLRGNFPPRQQSGGILAVWAPPPQPGTGALKHAEWRSHFKIHFVNLLCHFKNYVSGPFCAPNTAISCGGELCRQSQLAFASQIRAATLTCHCSYM